MTQRDAREGNQVQAYKLPSRKLMAQIIGLTAKCLEGSHCEMAYFKRVFEVCRASVHRSCLIVEDQILC